MCRGWRATSEVYWGSTAPATCRRCSFSADRYKQAAVLARVPVPCALACPSWCLYALARKWKHFRLPPETNEGADHDECGSQSTEATEPSAPCA